MGIDHPPELNLEDPDWRFPILEWLVEGKLPPRPDGVSTHHPPSKSFRTHRRRALQVWATGILMRCIVRDQGRELLQEIHVGTCGHHAVRQHLLGRLSDKVSTGPRRSQIPRTSCGAMKGASSTLDKLTSQHRRYRPSPSHGLSLFGTSIWWDLSDKRPGASPIFLWQSISSPNGLRLGLSSTFASRK
jgi:hypothetical protein